jgi:hypothetical protein
LPLEESQEDPAEPADTKLNNFIFINDCAETDEDNYNDKKNNAFSS